MTDDERGLGTGTILLSFVSGAALGIGLVLLYAQKLREDKEAEYEDGPLFI